MSRGIGVVRGTALYVGAVLGPGVLVLPALAVDAAGPASLLAWAGLLAVAAPTAMAFAAMGRATPDSGGVATFARRAFGPAAGSVAGWFYLAVPLGMVAGAVIGGQYLAAAWNLPPAAASVIAGGLLATAYGLNTVRLRLSASYALALTGGLVTLLSVAIAVSLPDVTSQRFTPFAPHGATGVGSAAALLFVAVCGWEASANLSGEFTNPRRQVPLATAASLLIVSTLYLGLAISTVGVRGDTAGDTSALLIRLIGGADDGAVATASAVSALVLTFGASFTFIAAAARAGAALGRDGALPRWFAGQKASRAPLRSLAVQAGAAALVMTAVVTAPSVVDLTILLRVFSMLLAAVTVVGLAAAVRLVRSRRIRVGAAMSATALTVVIAFSGALLWIPLVVALCAVAWTRIALPASAGRLAAPPHPSQTPVGQHVQSRPRVADPPPVHTLSGSGGNDR